ncbi:YcaO-like family protein [Cognatishimia sp. F0-27]|uniref:YcaO-like family protein n=1 Tax=Cognatishimia sp. F0-27 TaxID=2816855 RepID=UPI001D0CAB40|nr:YcaO-like family protein [Cognatishimia sp. F0-27]MCC1491919.1 YcaO-like family protein [Cognatishimia sp. F0-27]
MRWTSEQPDAATLTRALHARPVQALATDAFWARLRPRLPAFGITRMADITGLDRLGFPVVQAVRPLAHSNAVTQGKADTRAGAAVGAALECLEMAAGERPSRLPSAPPHDPALWRALAPGADWPTADTPFVAAWELSTMRRAAVPRDLLNTDFTLGAEAEVAPILRQSVGLGAGTTLATALMHGLLESIEADARIRADAQDNWQRRAFPAGDPRSAPLLDTLDKAGLRAALWQAPAALAGITVVRVQVMEEPGSAALPLPASGFAARPDAGAAIAAALAEAVQARLAVISGAREDITTRFYTHGYPPDVLRAEWARHAMTSSPVLRDRSGADEASAAPTTLAMLVEDIAPVFAVVLHHDPDLPLTIARVFAPSLILDPLRLEHAA